MTTVDEEFLELKASSKLTCYIGRLNEMRFKLEELINSLMNGNIQWDELFTRIKLLYKMIDLVVKDIKKDKNFSLNDFVLVPIAYTQESLLNSAGGKPFPVDASIFPNLLRTKVDLPTHSSYDQNNTNHDNIPLYYMQKTKELNSYLDQCIEALSGLEINKCSSSSYTARAEASKVAIKETEYQKLKELLEL